MPFRAFSVRELSLRGHFLLLVTLMFLTSISSQASSSEKGIEALLKESQQTLLGTEIPAEPKPTAPLVEKKQDLPVRELPPEPRVKVASSSSEEAPIDTSAIQKVIAIDLKAQEKEREPLYPLAKVSISMGSHWLRSGYALMKDDDYFYNEQGGRLGEIDLNFKPTWKLGFWETENCLPTASLVFGVGYSQGNMLLKRVGIQGGIRNYGIKLFSADVGLEVNALLWKWFGAFLGAGLGTEGFHQDGISVHDTTTQFFYGGELWLGVSAKVSSSIDLFLSYKRKGFSLMTPSFEGDMLSLGVAFNLAG